MTEPTDIHRSRDPLIETAVRPLSDNAVLHLAAAGFLENLKTLKNEGAEEAITRWNAADAGKRRLGWRIAFWVMLVAASAVCGWQIPANCAGISSGENG